MLNEPRLADMAIISEDDQPPEKSAQTVRSSAWRTLTNEQKRQRIDALEAERDRLRGLLNEVADSGVAFEDDRLSYVEVQIDSETFAVIRGEFSS
jgi:hypothetical protein